MAEKKFLVDLNLGGNKAKNFRLEDYASNSAPTSNFVGRLIYTTNSTDPDRVEVYTGTGWEQVAYVSDAPVLDQDLVDIAALTGDGVLVRQSGVWAMDNTNYVTLSGEQTLTNKTYEDAILKNHVSFINNSDVETMYIEHSYTGTNRIVSTDDISIRSTGGDVILYPGNDDGGTGRAYVHWGNDATDAGLGNEIVTRAATQILTNKTINDTLWFTNPSTIPNDGSIVVNDTNENFEITALNGNLVLGATNAGTTKAVVLSGTAGEFLNDPTDPDNQIATIGDINSEGVNSLTGTANQIAVDSSTGSVTISLTDEVRTNGLMLGGATYDSNGYLYVQDFEGENGFSVDIIEGFGQVTVRGDAGFYNGVLGSKTLEMTNDITDNFTINALLGELKLYSSSSAVVLQGDLGEYLNDPTDADNQIATIGDLSSGYQPLDTDLTNIAALTGTSGFLTTDGSNGWSVDTSTYLTTETDPVFTASEAYNITSTDTGNWDTAYGWGDHSVVGYLTTETDPTFTASEAYNITSTDTANWDTAYGWGDHSIIGYLTTAVESISNTDGNITFSTSTGIVTADLSTDVEISGDLIVQGDLTVNGDVTTLNTATMNVEDNLFVLNSNVTGTPSINAGIEVERGSYTNAAIYWNETSNLWSVDTVKDSTAAAVSHSVARKYSESLNDPSPQTSYVITHSLNTRDVIAQVYTIASPYEQVETSIEYTSVDTITVTFNTATTGEYRVVVTG